MPNSSHQPSSVSRSASPSSALKPTRAPSSTISPADKLRAALSRYQVTTPVTSSTDLATTLFSGSNSPSASTSAPDHVSTPSAPPATSVPTISVAKNPYISHQHQLRALELASKYADLDHKIYYLNLCKKIHPAIIDQADSFVADAQAHHQGKLFMWKIKQLKAEWQQAGKDWKNPAILAAATASVSSPSSANPKKSSKSANSSCSSSAKPPRSRRRTKNPPTLSLFDET